MGGAQTKEAPNLNPGIYVTSNLVAQLQGKLHGPKRLLTDDADPAGAPRQQTLEHAVRKRIKQDQELRQALEESTLAGELLLKREGEELRQVNNYADELLKKEYRIPSKDPPCIPERSKVTACYKDNLQDPLECAVFVDAYANCADAARKAFTKSQVSQHQ